MDTTTQQLHASAQALENPRTQIVHLGVPDLAVRPEAINAVNALGHRFTIVRIESPSVSAAQKDDFRDTPVYSLLSPRPREWGPFGFATSHPQSALAQIWNANPVIHIDPGDPTDLIVASSIPVIVVGIEHRDYAPARAIIDRLRSRHPHVVVAEMGLDTGTSDYADIATFGSTSRHGETLIGLLTGECI